MGETSCFSHPIRPDLQTQFSILYPTMVLTATTISHQHLPSNLHAVLHPPQGPPGLLTHQPLLPKAASPIRALGAQTLRARMPAPHHPSCSVSNHAQIRSLFTPCSSSIMCAKLQQGSVLCWELREEHRHESWPLWRAWNPQGRPNPIAHCFPNRTANFPPQDFVCVARSRECLSPAPAQPRLVLAAMALPLCLFSGSNSFLSQCSPPRSVLVSQNPGSVPLTITQV